MLQNKLNIVNMMIASNDLHYFFSFKTIYRLTRFVVRKVHWNHSWNIWHLELPFFVFSYFGSYKEILEKIYAILVVQVPNQSAQNQRSIFILRWNCSLQVRPRLRTNDPLCSWGQLRILKFVGNCLIISQGTSLYVT